ELGIPARGNALYQVLHEGLPTDVFSRLARATNLDKQSLARALAIAPATLQRRLKVGRFGRDESDRLYRLAYVFSCTLDLFEGDVLAAQAWLQRPVRGLGGERPLDMLGTSAQSGAVLDLIGRLEHGVFA